MKIIIITVIIIAVVILGGRWYLHWLKKCYDRKQKQCREQETFIFDKLNQGENLSKTYDRLRNSAKKTIIVLVACILVLGCGAYFVDASYKQWSADFKQWKVERAERKAQAELQKQKEKRLEAERKAEEARKQQERRLEAERKAEEARKRQERRLEAERKAEEARKQQEIASLKAEQFQKLQNQNIVQKKAEQRKKNIFIAKVNFCILIFAIFLFLSFFLCILYCAGSKK